MPNSNKYNGMDLTGERHGRLIVVRKATFGKTQWVVRCDCGKEITVPAFKFFQNMSCGCLEKENRANIGKRTKTHGMSESRLYNVWNGMKCRCYNPETRHFKEYGGRGITVCDEWKDSFENFMEWAYSNGYDETKDGKSQSLDRIDVNKGYGPSNCRWVDHTMQMRNTRRTMYLYHEGAKVSVREFCERYNITYPHFVFRRVSKNIDSQDILREWQYSMGLHEGYYDVDEASRVYSRKRYTIENWIKKGWIKAEKVGQHWYIPIGQPCPV